MWGSGQVASPAQRMYKDAHRTNPKIQRPHILKDEGESIDYFCYTLI